MLQALKPFTFVPISVLPLMNSVAFSLTVLPFSYVRISEDTLPNPVTFFDSVSPFAIVDLSVCPTVDTLAMRFSVQKVSFILVVV
jgi:hypothetical protein